jgi:hypothetical protein
MSGEATPSFRSHYDDFRMVGKHFRVRWEGNINISRHYTVCNVMEPSIYRAYLESLRTDSPLNKAILDTKPRDSCIFAIKNYN